MKVDMAIPRRDIVKSLAIGAGSVLAPTVRSVVAADARVGSPPVRFVFVLQSNGFHPWAAQPKEIKRTDKGPDRVVVESLSDKHLADDMKPLEPFKHKMTILQRLNGVHTKPFHSAYFGALSGTLRSISKPRAETIDAALAKALPGRVPIVNLGIDNSSVKAKPWGRDTTERKIERSGVCSAWGPGKPMATHLQPDVAYRSLFGPGSPGEGDKDLKRIKDKAVRLKSQPKLDARYRSPIEAKRLEAQFELAGASLISGLTNVVTICSGACFTGGLFEGVGLDDQELHSLGHFRGDGKRSWQQLYTVLRQYHFKLIAELVSKLEATPEGYGTMMDNTVIVYTSDGAETHHSRGKEWPFVLIGNLQNRLKSDRFVEYPAYEKAGNRSINALYCTLLHAAGAKRDHFNLSGDLKKIDKPGPLPELLS